MAYPYRVVLSEAQRAELRGLVGSGTAPARTLTRARILLKADHGDGGPGWSDAAIAGRWTSTRAPCCACAANSSPKGWRRRCSGDGRTACTSGGWTARGGAPRRAGLLRAPGRPGALEPAPAGRRAGAPAGRRAGAPGGGGGRLPRDGAPDAQKNALKPHLSEQWCLAPTADPDFVWRMEDVLAVYAPLRPGPPGRVPRRDQPAAAREVRPRCPRRRPPAPPRPGVRPRRGRQPLRGDGAAPGLAHGPGQRPADAARPRPLHGGARRRPLPRRREDRPRAGPAQHPLARLALRRLLAGRGQAPRRQAGAAPTPSTAAGSTWPSSSRRARAAVPPAEVARPRRRHDRGHAGLAERRNASVQRIDWQFTTADARTKLRRLYPAFAG